MSEKEIKNPSLEKKEVKETKKVEQNSTKENKETTANAEVKKPIVSREKLLEAGTYFGHKASQWNPKMKEFLLPKPNKGVHIINANLTLSRLEFAYQLLHKLASNKKLNFIFVGTKKQAKEAIKENAIRTRSHYVSERWLGGILTNSSTIFSRVKTMEDLEKKAEKNFEGYTKKESLLFKKELDKLHKNLEGIRNMNAFSNFPNVMIVADPIENAIAIKEARKKGVKVFGILDSNADPYSLDFGIPANDDSAKSISLIITILADAIATARGGQAKFAYQPDEKIVFPEFINPERRENNFQRRPFVKREYGERNNFKKETTNTQKEVKENTTSTQENK